jgi:peptidoglycan/LPS O-acetylase OafA/YrhL
MVVKWRYPDIGFFLPFTTIYIKYIVHFGIWFTAGMALSVTSQYWLRYKARIAAVSFILLLGLFTKQMPFAILYVLWPVFVLSFGNCKTAIISGLDKFGDPSYGVYIYGFVVQQTLMYYCYPSISLMAFLGLSIAISLLLGYISWHLIEKRALRWKKLPAMKMAMATKETV